MIRVDAHHHIWDLTIREQSWMVGPELDPIRRNFSIDDLAPQAAAAGVTSTVLVQTVGLVEETVEFLEVAANDDLVAGVVGWVDLTADDVAAALDGLRSRPDGSYLKAIRHQVHDEPDVGWLLRPDVQRGLAAVADAGLAYDLLTKTPHLPAAIQTVRNLPQLTFVVDHISKPVIGEPLEPWAGHLRELAALPNVTCKLSGMVTEAPWTTWKPADLQPYAETGPIFLHASECARYEEERLPAWFDYLDPAIVRGYGGDHWIRYDTGDVVRGSELTDACRRILADETVAYVHIRSKYNCFQCRVDRIG